MQHNCYKCDVIFYFSVYIHILDRTILTNLILQ